MKAIIKNIAKKTITTKDGRKFDKIVISADVVINDKNGEVRTYKSEMSVDYAKRYFAFCGLSSKELPGRECDVTLRKREFQTKEGETRYVTEIKYLNMIGADGLPVIMKNKTEESAEDLGF